MFELVKGIFRKRAIKKWGSKQPTSLIPLESLKSVAILMDVEDAGFQESMDEAAAWFKSRGLHTELHFFDFRHLEKDELLLTSIQNTVLKKDLNWFDMPDPAHVTDIHEDLFISLVDNADFPVRFFSTCCRSRFKIGRCGWEGHPFDLLVTSRPDTPVKDVFEEMAKYLFKIT